MSATSGWMKASDVFGREARRPGGDWSGMGWTDSSWELKHGLDVVEDLPLDAWPAEFPAPAPAEVKERQRRNEPSAPM
jgi:hypothetical protein